MNFDYIFILTYGRSGSTLLQGALNAIPGVQIRGENAGALHGLFYSWQAAKIAREQFSEDSEGTTSPWFGANLIDVDQFGQDLANALIGNILQPTADVEVTGFKEIRYFDMPLSDLMEQLDFMRRYFKKAAFVINTRDTAATVLSSQNAGHDMTQDQIEASDFALRELVAMPSSDTFHVHYDDYKDDPEALMPLFEFLGAPFDQSAMRSVFETKHSG